MTKYTITKNGEIVNPSLYSWNEDTKTFTSKLNNLVLDFSNSKNCTFVTGFECTFTTGSNCTFKTGDDCTFVTGSNCTFNVGSDCIFKTGSRCTFKTGSGCNFTTSWGCNFNTGSNCIFKTGYGCVVIRRDIYEVIELEESLTTKLNEYGIKGFEILEKKQEMTVQEMTIQEIETKLGIKNLKIIK